MTDKQERGKPQKSRENKSCQPPIPQTSIPRTSNLVVPNVGPAREGGPQRTSLSNVRHLAEVPESRDLSRYIPVLPSSLCVCMLERMRKSPKEEKGGGERGNGERED